MKRLGTLTLGVALLFGAGALRADDQAEMRALVEKAVKAHGGAEALEKAQAGTTKFAGKYYGMGEGIPFTGTSQYQRPDKFRVEMELEVMGKAFRFVQIVNGDKGWVALDGKVMDFDKDQIAAARDQIYEHEVGHLLPLRDKAFKLSPLGEVKVDGRAALGVHVEREGRRDLNLFFDKENGLLLKLEGRSTDPMNPSQEFTGETYHGGYRKIDGVMVPFKTTVKRDGKLYVEVETTEASVAPKLDDSLFAKP